jgi:hypothetical protein
MQLHFARNSLIIRQRLRLRVLLLSSSSSSTLREQPIEFLAHSKGISAILNLFRKYRQWNPQHGDPLPVREQVTTENACTGMYNILAAC